jgi:flagellar motor switch protein FliN/FliY
MGNGFLSQEEIDALLKQAEESLEIEISNQDRIVLTAQEQDILGEIGNINAGAASTALSELLGQRVIMDVPKIWVTTYQELHESYQVPYILVEVNYISGIEGSNQFVIKTSDAAIIADLMMGGNGKNPPSELDEISISAVSEAMNQMVGTAATAMSEVFKRTIMISTPEIIQMDSSKGIFSFRHQPDEDIVVIAFNLSIGDLVKSEIMLIMNLDMARREVEYLYDPEQVTEPLFIDQEKDDSTNQEPHTDDLRSYSNGTPALLKPDNYDKEKLDLILDIPLKVSVLLGKTRKSIGEVLNFGPGSIVELERMADEPVDVLVNGVLIARGEVVVVEEYFGIRITDIISPENRVINIGKNI